MRSPTTKQLALIKRIEIALDVTFKGKTASDASNFITTNIEAYKEEQAFVFNMVYNENNY